MSYAALGEYDAAAAVEGCVETTEADWDTAGGRKKGAQAAGNCAAESACAYFTGGASAAAGGICGDVAEAVVGAVVDGWNAVFGNEEEWEAYRKQRADTAAMFAKLQQAKAFDQIYAAMFYDATSQLVQFAHANLPARRALEIGRLPCKRTPVLVDGQQISDSSGTPLTRLDCYADRGASRMLSRYGADVGTATRADEQGRPYPAIVPASVVRQAHAQCTGSAAAQRNCAHELLEHASAGNRWIQNLNRAFAKARAELIAEAAVVRMRNVATAKEGVAKIEAIRAAFREDQRQQRTRALVGLAILAAGAYGAYKIRGKR